MPKHPFFNLPEQKRQSIEQVAPSEFSLHGFDRFKMNRIVEHSGIAKGSFHITLRGQEGCLPPPRR